MGLHLKRKKKRNLFLSLIYRISKLLIFVSPKYKLKLFLSLEWIFDRLAHEESYKVFDYETHPARLHTISFIKKHVKSNHNVLDLGCNYGEITNKIAEFSNKVVGVDYNQQEINKAKNIFKRNNLEFIHGDAFTYLEKTQDKFDVIILSHILEHLDEPSIFLNKCKEHTQSIYIEVPDFNKSYLNHYRIISESSLNYTDSDHIWEFDRTELFILLNNCNLKIVDCEFQFGVIKIWSEL